MNRVHAIHLIDRLLRSSRYPVPRKRIQQELECSRATFSRLIELMRDTLNAPIEYDRKANGYYYAVNDADDFVLPGLWFTAEEIYALLTSYQLLSTLQPYALKDYNKGLIERLEKILASQGHSVQQVKNHIKIIAKAARKVDNQIFQQVSISTLERKRILIQYHGRQADEKTKRTVSPQRLVYYGTNWYLDAWCHTRQALRTFSLDRIRGIVPVNKAAKTLPVHQLDEYFSSSYGIFSGKPRHMAKLLFSANQARWVMDEEWHPEQKGCLHADGSYELVIPYNDPRELIMDILKYGPEVEVLEPESLRAEIKKLLTGALANYEEKEGEVESVGVGEEVV